MLYWAQRQVYEHIYEVIVLAVQWSSNEDGTTGNGRRPRYPRGCMYGSAAQRVHLNCSGFLHVTGWIGGAKRLSFISQCDLARSFKQRFQKHLGKKFTTLYLKHYSKRLHSGKMTSSNQSFERLGHFFQFFWGLMGYAKYEKNGWYISRQTFALPKAKSINFWTKTKLDKSLFNFGNFCGKVWK